MAGVAAGSFITGLFDGIKIKHGWEDRKRQQAFEDEDYAFLRTKRDWEREDRDWLAEDRAYVRSERERVAAERKAEEELNKRAADAAAAAMAAVDSPLPTVPPPAPGPDAAVLPQTYGPAGDPAASTPAATLPFPNLPPGLAVNPAPAMPLPPAPESINLPVPQATLATMPPPENTPEYLSYYMDQDPKLQSINARLNSDGWVQPSIRRHWEMEKAKREREIVEEVTRVNKDRDASGQPLVNMDPSAYPQIGPFTTQHNLPMSTYPAAPRSVIEEAADMVQSGPAPAGNGRTIAPTAPAAPSGVSALTAPIETPGQIASPAPAPAAAPASAPAAAAAGGAAPAAAASPGSAPAAAAATGVAPGALGAVPGSAPPPASAPAVAAKTLATSGPSATPTQQKDELERFMEAYTTKSIPILVEGYIRLGQTDKAMALVELARSEKGQRTMKLWAETAQAVMMGDEKKSLDGFAAYYNAFDDGYELIRDKSGFVRDESGRTQGINLTFKTADGQEFTQFVAGTEDLLAMAVNSMSWDKMFEYMWDRAVSAQNAEADAAKAELGHQRDIELRGIGKSGGFTLEDGLKFLSENQLNFSAMPPDQQRAAAQAWVDIMNGQPAGSGGAEPPMAR